MSADDETFGNITKANLAFTALTGYKLLELKNRNVRALMPSIYAVHHD
jgi:PAS domain S-box-containing protein